MALLLSPEEESIRDEVRRFVRQRAPIAHLRRLRDAKDPAGFSPELWREMAALGFPSITSGREAGGASIAWTQLGIVLEECGRTLVPTPLVSTVLLGAATLSLGGARAQRERLLPEIAEGKRILAFAHEEGTRHAPYHVALRATARGERFQLSGEKVMVLDGHVADDFIVVARTSGRPGDRDGLTLFLVPARGPGIEVTRSSVIDGRNAARVRFLEVPVTRAEVLGEVDGGADLLDTVLDQARVGLAAEMLGSLSECFDRTLEFLKTRRQFGVPIGSFQALKHRAAQMFCELELVRSIVLGALRALDERRPDVPLLASAAKARASDAFLWVANEAVQMHGGLGVTDDCDIGLFLKRARVAAMTLGDSTFHRDRFARLQRF